MREGLRNGSLCILKFEAKRLEAAMNKSQKQMGTAAPQVLYPSGESKYSPEAWHAKHLEGFLHRSTFICKLLDCVAHGVDIGRVIRCIPVNLFPRFMVSVNDAAELEGDKKVIVFGGVIDWTAEDARRVLRWLGEHPEPEMAPDDGRNYNPDPTWEPPVSDFQRETERLLDQGILPPNFKAWGMSESEEQEFISNWKARRSANKS